MCTASIIPLCDPQRSDRLIGVRLITNRDELRSRPPALPPAWFTPDELAGDVRVERSYRRGWGSRRAVYPVDPVGGGTWVAATTGGLVLCLLNANPPTLPGWMARDRDRLISRGTIIPGLLNSETARAAASRVPDLALDRLAPFTLLAADLSLRPEPSHPSVHRGSSSSETSIASRVWRAVWDGRSMVVDELGVAPVCVASSGLGDHLVAPRLPLFDAMVRNVSPDAGQADAQDRFHRHRWPGRPEISVLMSRREARTVSITTVELLADPSAKGATVTMVYETIEEPARAVTQIEPTGMPSLIRHHAQVVATGAA